MNKVKGIVLTKKVFQDRHLICDLLVESGAKIAVIFYGGQGGGKKSKSSLLELGYVLDVTLARYKSNHQGIYSAKEFKLSWYHEQIRNDYSAFYTLCFFTEIISKVATEDDLSIGDNHQQGIFRVLSNGVFHIEDSLKNEQFEKQTHLTLFISKLIFELGITPQLDHCILSEVSLEEIPEFQLQFDKGGFAHKDYLTKEGFSNHKDLWRTLKIIWNLNYKDYLNIKSLEPNIAHTLYYYFLYQIQVKPEQVRSASSVLNS